MRAAHDFLGAPALLVSGVLLVGLPEYARIAVPGGYCVPLEWRADVERAARVHARCKACELGEACPQWNWTLLADHGVTPRQASDKTKRTRRDDDVDQAAKLLDLNSEESKNTEAVQKSFKKLALIHHPDRGGSTEKMARLTAARDLLLATIACRSK